ncbi:MAG: ABC transporter permease [Gemmatimonadota bacterium]
MGDADRLVEVWQEEPGAASGASRSASLNAYLAWRERSRTVDRIGLWSTARATLTGEGDPRDVLLVEVSPGLAPALGLRPVLGRGLIEGDDASAAPVVVLSHATWTSVFGGDPGRSGDRSDWAADCTRS